MKNKKRTSLFKEGGKTILSWVVLLSVGIVIDLFYWFGSKYWLSCKLVILLLNCHISYGSLFKILGSNFGVIITMVGMFFTINNNISERFEKKVYGIPRINLYSKENENIFYKYSKRMCMCAPLLMLVFLNIEFCVSGYLVLANVFFSYYNTYRRHASSFSNPSDAVIKKLKEYIPKEGEWSKEKFSEFQILLENIGRSGEEEGNWLELQELYKKFLESSQEYDDVKRYLSAYYFYEIVFWKREKRSGILPMQILRTYIKELDVKAAGIEQIPEREFPILWGITKAAVCEADEEELRRFLGDFLDFSERSKRVMSETEERVLQPLYLEKMTGIVLILLECRLQKSGELDDQLVDYLWDIWRYGSPALANEEKDLTAKLAVLNANLMEDNEIISEAIENLTRGSCESKELKRSLIGYIISDGQEEKDEE